MPRYRQFVLTAIALVAFAANSLLCRAALKSASVDPATFTTIRLVSGALVLWLLMRARRVSAPGTGNWISAGALFAYAAGFSFAYITLSAATGALLLFGAVQATMIGRGLWNGERLRKVQLAGLLLALAGVLALLLPDAAAPALLPSLLMLGAGMAWGIYSLRGKGAGDPLSVTAGNFLRAVPMAVGLNLGMAGSVNLDTAGLAYAVLSGALASGAGYAVWYSVLPALKASTASIAQLGVPIIAAAAAIVFLGEPLTARFALAALAVLGGIWLVLGGRHASARDPKNHSGAGLERADTVLPSDERRRRIGPTERVIATVARTRQIVRDGGCRIGLGARRRDETSIETGLVVPHHAGALSRGRTLGICLGFYCISIVRTRRRCCPCHRLARSRAR